MFFVFDGMDGTGKTTQLEMFADYLNVLGHDVVTCKDPGTTELGNRMRELLLVEQGLDIHLHSELLLFMTARAQLTEQIIRPALDSGKTVVCDRYVFSTVVYQGYAGDLEPDVVWELNHFATNGIRADLTFIFDLPAEEASRRLGSSLDRMEARGIDYFEKVKQGFLAESKRWPSGVEVIDAAGTPQEVQARVRSIADSLPGTSRC